VKGLPRIAFILTLGISTCANAQLPYAASSIPAELKENVDAVVREDVYMWSIQARDRSSIKVRLVVTVMNPNGDKWADVAIYYDKLEKISDLKVNVYDQLGLPIRKVKNSEFKDVGTYDGFSLFSDNRVKYVDVAQSVYPYTVELEYSKDYKYLYNSQGSAILSTPRTSVQHFRYEITYPSQLAPRYKLLNIDVKPQQSKNADGTETLLWDVTNVLGLKAEPVGPSFSDVNPEIIAAPTLFEFSGYAGNMSTWRGLNDWILLLNKGRDEIPESTKQKVAELTRGLKTTEEKAKVLYEYLQGKTRYVSIQLGIGGYQPFEASVVDQVGYGDCKALSNYMVSLLKAAGIKGNYTLIRAGEDAPGMMVDFPSSQFNHAIVAIPDGKDTLWLECTSQTNPFGFQGRFTGNRKAFMITEEGGKVVNTKRYPADENVRVRNASVTLQANGDAKAQVTTLYEGLRYDAGSLSHYLTQSADDQKKWLLDNIRIPNFNIDQFRMTNHKAVDPSARLDVTLTLSRYASVSGKRIFVTPNLMSRSTYIPEAVASRKSNVVVKMGFVDHDTIVYSIPESVYPEFVPPAISHNSRFGTYEAAFFLDEGKLVYTRRLTVREGNYPPESYQEYIDFYRNVSKADNMKLVFLSKT